MKPFDLEKAKAGAPVCTRDGRKARIICWDAGIKKNKNIVALIYSQMGHVQDIYSYYESGECDRGSQRCEADLMMAEQKITKWTNIYDMHGTYTNGDFYGTEKEARKSISYRGDYVATIKVEWEE